MRVLHFLRRMRRWLFWRVWDNIVRSRPLFDYVGSTGVAALQ